MRLNVRVQQKHPAILLITVVIVLCACGAYAENIDPDSTGCRYAWGENVGWINFKPAQGPGVSVNDTAVTGMAWGENIGWINLNPAGGGVVNNAKGILSGYAWGENVGWINFKPVGGGVSIGNDGKFAGYAWGENIGWINFSSANTCVKTAWVPLDTTPEPFTFMNQTDVALNTLITSNTITVTGINTPTPISITGGLYSVSGGPFTAASGTVNNGDSVRVQLLSSGAYATTTSTTLTLGDVSGTFSATTITNPPPVAGFIWKTDPNLNYNVFYDASASTCPAGTTCTYSWSTGETGVTTSHTFSSSTTTPVILTVTNSEGSGTASMAVTPRYVGSAPTTVNMTASTNGYVVNGTYSVSDGIAPYTVTAKWGDGTTSSLSGGSFTHNYVNAGTYTIMISATDFGDNGSYRTTGSASQSVTIAAAASTISGTVTRADGTTPLPGALVQVKGTSPGTTSYVVVTKTDGTYTQGSLKPGTYTVSVTKSGYTFPTSPQTGMTPGTVVNFRSSL